MFCKNCIRPSGEKEMITESECKKYIEAMTSALEASNQEIERLREKLHRKHERVASSNIEGVG